LALFKCKGFGQYTPKFLHLPLERFAFQWNFVL